MASQVDKTTAVSQGRGQKRQREQVLFTWVDIDDFDVNKKIVKLKFGDGKSEWLDPLESLNTAGGFEILISHLKKAAEASHSTNEDKELEDWIEMLEDHHACYVQRETDDHATDNEIAFCCAICWCNPDEKRNDCISSSEFSLFHRYCCHKINRRVSKLWKSDLDKKTAEYGRMIETNRFVDVTGKKGTAVTAASIEHEGRVAWDEENAYHCKNYIAVKKKADWALRTEVEEKNARELEDAFSVLLTHEVYSKNCKDYFQIRTKRITESKLHKAVVLELFGGVGSGTVALKKLGVGMKKVIFAECDNVATHVMRHNHDTLYNKDLPDTGVEHVEYESFESIYNNFDSFMLDHAPIDIVIGGPPCQDFSRINATRKGVKGAQGAYLPNFADLIRRIQEEQGDHPLFYLVENVVLHEFDDIQRTEEAFGCTAVMLDAQHFSPTRRNRHYWTNFKLNSFDFQGRASMSISASCLDDGWQHPAVAWADVNKDFEPSLQKANTFMASKSRLDDQPRMMKVKEVGDKKFEVSSFSVSERERMLGYPDGYVMRAVEYLYSELYEKAYSKQATYQIPWKDDLDEKFHCFSGYPPKFIITENGIAHSMSTPQSGKSLIFFDKEQYSKHLLGNAFSIPVIEHLLEPLACLFDHQEYDGYNYQYKWDLAN